MEAIDVNHLYQYGLLNVNNPHYLHVVEKALNKGIEPTVQQLFKRGGYKNARNYHYLNVRL